MKMIFSIFAAITFFFFYSGKAQSTVDYVKSNMDKDHFSPSDGAKCVGTGGTA